MKIDSYPNDNNISLDDKVTGTDSDNSKKTKSYTFRAIKDFLIAQGFIIKYDVKYVLANTYSIMLDIPNPPNLIIVKVLNDENKGIENTIYHIYPDGVRMWIASVRDN